MRRRTLLTDVVNNFEKSMLNKNKRPTQETTAARDLDLLVDFHDEGSWEKADHPLDKVNHPPHYISNGLEVIDVIEAFNLNFNLGNAIKYILRAGRKNPENKGEDLNKAIWYLNRDIGVRK